MAEILSPGIKISEKNQVYYDMQGSNAIAIFVGEFEKGPINEPVFITDVLQFKYTFGRSTETNYNQWYQVYNYLQYTNGLFVCRTAGEKRIKANNNGNIANSPGDWGNIMTVEIYKKSEFENNKELQTFFNEYNLKNYLILIRRIEQVVENFSIDDISEFKSNYIENINLDYGIYKLENGYTQEASSIDYYNSYFLFTKEDYEIDIIIADENNNESAIQLAEYRKDCIAFLGLPRKFIEMISVNDLVLTTESGLIIYFGKTEIKYLLTDIDYNIINNYIDSLPKTSYAFFSIGFALMYDGFTGKQRIINLNSDIAGLKSFNSNNTTWKPSAGIERGTVKHEKITLIIKKEWCDELYKKGVNTFENNTMMTQKLFQDFKNFPSSLYQRDVLNYIKRISEKLLNKYVFNLNDKQTRGTIAVNLKKELETVVSGDGIESAKILVEPGKNENTIIININIKFKSVIESINIRMFNAGNDLFTEITGE